MISAEENLALTRVGPGSLMGGLFRRYWLPALLAAELPEPGGAQVRVKLLGEQLIAFRDTGGRIGLVDEFCAHRGVSLWFGRNEAGGLRCAYHGWKYDVTGQCVELPSEGPHGPMRKRMRLNAYPCLELGGVVWTYMGPPQLRPEPPGIEWAHVPPERRYVSKRLQESNYLQAMEGGIDSSHVSFLHSAQLKSDPLFKGSKGNEYNLKDTMPEFEVVDFPGGLFIGARRNAEGGRYYWRITPWIMPAHTIIPPRAGHPLGAHVWVPIDDESCWAWSINYHPKRSLFPEEISAMKSGKGIHCQYVPGTFTPKQNKGNDYLMDRTSANFSGVEGIAMQDASLQESMGPIQDRTRENLCPTDRGIVMARMKLLDAARTAAAGKAVPALAAAEQRVRSCSIELPREQHFREHARHGLFAAPDSDPVTV